MLGETVQLTLTFFVAAADMRTVVLDNAVLLLATALAVNVLGTNAVAHDTPATASRPTLRTICV